MRYHNGAALEWFELDEKGAAWKPLCPRCSKCLQARLELGFFVFFLWSFDLRLIAVSAFSTYWILHNMHSVSSIMHSLLKLRLKKILNVRFVCWMWLYSSLGCSIDAVTTLTIVAMELNQSIHSALWYSYTKLILQLIYIISVCM